MKQLRKIPFFAALTDNEVQALAQAMTPRDFTKGELIFKQGDPGDALYIIDAGGVKVVADDGPEADVFAHLGEGDFFGEMALLTGKPRSAAVRAITDTRAFLLKKCDFDKLLAEHPTLALSISSVLSRRLAQADRQLVEQRLKKVFLFSALAENELYALAQKLQPRQYKRNWLIYAEGEPGEEMFIIQSGKVKVVSDAATEKHTLATLSDGDFFGEMALLAGGLRSAAVRAITDLNVWVLSKCDFEEMVNAHPAIGLELSRALSQRLLRTDQALAQRRPPPRPAPATSALERPVVPIARPVAPSLPSAGPLLEQLREAGAGLAAWFLALSRGAQLRLAIIVILALWLLLISAPATVLTLAASLGSPKPYAALEFSATPTPTRAITSMVSGDPGAPPTFTPLPTLLAAQLTVEPPTPTPAPPTLPPPTLAPPTPRPQASTYMVQAGDTISGIAERFGTTTALLLQANGLASSSIIRPGDELTIPGSDRPTAPKPTTAAVAIAALPATAMPTATALPSPTPTPQQSPTPTAAPISWDPRLNGLNVALVPANPAPGQTYWRLTRAEFQDVDQSGGNHNIYVWLLDEGGNRVTGQSVIFGLTGGEEIKGPMDEKPPPEANFNYPMYGDTYSARVQGISDKVTGMTMPMHQHVNYVLFFQRATK